jgi:hypothetical protein
VGFGVKVAVGGADVGASVGSGVPVWEQAVIRLKARRNNHRKDGAILGMIDIIKERGRCVK